MTTNRKQGTSKVAPTTEIIAKEKLNDKLKIKDLEEKIENQKMLNRGMKDYLRMVDTEMGEGAKAYIVSQQLIDICIPYETAIGTKSEEYKEFIMASKGKLAFEIEEVIHKHVEAVSKGLEELLAKDKIKKKLSGKNPREINLS